MRGALALSFKLVFLNTTILKGIEASSEFFFSNLWVVFFFGSLLLCKGEVVHRFHGWPSLFAVICGNEVLPSCYVWRSRPRGSWALIELWSKGPCPVAAFCLLSTVSLSFRKVSGVTDVKGSCVSALTLQPISAWNFHRGIVSADVSYSNETI